MALRGQKPQEVSKRLKALLYSPAGVGKTTAAIQMPRPYIIDSEQGSVHYGALIEESGGAVFNTTSIHEVIEEVKELASTKHPFRSIIIDPFTPIYDTIVDEGEERVGTDHGRHYGYAGKFCKRLFNLLGQIDMNVLVTCHAKNLYGDKMAILGTTFDGWKKLDYLYDLVFELVKVGSGVDARRQAIVRKTRLDAFPDGSMFDWSYEELAARCGRDVLERESQQIAFCDKDTVDEIEHKHLVMGDGWLGRALARAEVSCVEELPQEKADKVLAMINEKNEQAA